MKRFVLMAVLSLGLAACDSPTQAPAVFKNTTSVPVPTPVVEVQTQRYEIETLEFKGWAGPQQCHQVVAEWIAKHPDRTLVQVVPWSIRFGTGGISFISTATR
jgi:hypothetical protein